MRYLCNKYMWKKQPPNIVGKLEMSSIESVRIKRIEF